MFREFLSAFLLEILYNEECEIRDRYPVVFDGRTISRQEFFDSLNWRVKP